MNTRAILAITRKDLKVAMQNKGVVLPIIILPLILFIIFGSPVISGKSRKDVLASE